MLEFAICCEGWRFKYFEDYVTALQSQIPHLRIYLDEAITTFSNRVLQQLSRRVEDVEDDAVFVVISMQIIQPKLTELIAAQDKRRLFICLLNTEQLTRVDQLERLLSIAEMPSNLTLLDYSVENMQCVTEDMLSDLLPDRKILYHLLPYPNNPTETESLKALLAATPKRYDIAFVGTPSQYRTDIIDELQRRLGKTVIWVTAFGRERDQQIASATLLLNIHFAEEFNVYESLRCDRWLFAGQRVISEDSINNEELDVRLTNLITFVPYSKLVETVLTALESAKNLPQHSQPPPPSHQVCSRRNKLLQQFVRQFARVRD